MVRRCSGSAMLRGTALAKVHDAVLAVELGAIARDALFAEEVALCDLLAVDGMEQVEVRKILMKSLHFLGPAAALRTVESIPLAVGHQCLQARSADAVEARQDLHFMAAFEEGGVMQAQLAHDAADLVRRIVHILEKLPFASFQLLNERVDLWADLDGGERRFLSVIDSGGHWHQELLVQPETVQPGGQRPGSHRRTLHCLRGAHRGTRIENSTKMTQVCGLLLGASAQRRGRRRG
mmetsp:Transcript_2803/g.6705  ORF Transcript_2803/g.6705 Transcript_2803/m.6705 type:complete len:236 (-) Transcript_2803:105-812(-)